MSIELEKIYNPQEVEKKIYTLWEESGYFNPDNLPITHKKTYTVIMPPPNANGRLHAGHGLDMTLKDIAIRFKRMQGFKTLLVPGADHAGFETQIVYERKLEREGKTRFDLKPHELYKQILAFTLENKQFMEDDIRRLGTSCDWSRKKFTLDKDVITEVQKTFEKMYTDNLIYRGSRIVNWCTKHQTSLSDVETEFKNQTSKFYYLKYGPFVIGTARPETKFGDKYVVMHPDDDRYKDYIHGQKIEIEWINGPITATIIKDTAIDMKFGTGVMTITPWHDQIDFDIAERHDLKKEQIIDFDGKLLPIAGEFAGMSIDMVRTKIIEKLDRKNLIEKIDDTYEHSIKVCYKCDTPIEPQIKKQWFVKMKPLAKIAIEPVKNGRIQFIPQRFEKIFFHWMNNTIDWNISRQIIWGIPIPAKICTICNYGAPDLADKITKCPDCKNPVQKDTDTFDTWFSSGQWPLLALNYPNNNDFKKYYPTDIMETGADLVFKWVPRMIMFGMYLTKEIPFKTVYFHGMVNDEHNQKMSKSKGNVISPVELSDEFGTDALRMALIIGNGPGNNVLLSRNKVKANRNFTNKLWNISRYILQSCNKKEENKDGNRKNQKIILSLTDRWVHMRLSTVIKEVTEHLEKYNFSLAAETLRDFTWNDFANWYLEIHKIEKNDITLFYIFETLLKLWHPFMPFVTEEIFQKTRQNVVGAGHTLLLIEKWPHRDEEPKDREIIKQFDLLKETITRIRNLRSEYRIDPKTEITVTLITQSRVLQENSGIIKRLIYSKKLTIKEEEKGEKENVASAITENAKIYLHLDNIIDKEKELERLEKELKNNENFKKNVENKLRNKNFTDHAPEEIVRMEKEKLKNTEEKIEKIKLHIQRMS